jgi:hypothetical protein
MRNKTALEYALNDILAYQRQMEHKQPLVTLSQVRAQFERDYIDQTGTLEPEEMFRLADDGWYFYEGVRQDWYDYLGAIALAPHQRILPENPYIDLQIIKTNRRLTFDILRQSKDVTWFGDDDGDYPTYRATNGYEIISRSRMDIQTERVWLRGGVEDDRSGSMVFSSNEKRDKAYDAFVLALNEWLEYVERKGKWPEAAQYRE